MFEVDRGDGEKIKVMYSVSKDTYFQLQESVFETSMFIEKAILKGESIMLDNINLDSKTYLVTEIDPMFFLLKPLRSGVASGQKMMYQTLS